MKQQNYLYVEIVSSIFLLILLICNFLGLLYITEGSVVLSMLGSMFLVVCYFFVIQLLKKNKEVMVRRKYKHGSLIFWVFFFMLGCFSFFLMSHFINVEYNCKEIIKIEANRKINLVDSIAAVYKKRAKDDIQNFKFSLKDKLRKYKSPNNSIQKNELTSAPYSISEELLSDPDFINVDQIVNAITTPAELKITNNIKNLDSTISWNSSNYQSVFDNWKRLSLVTGYAKLNEYVEDNIKIVNSKIGELPLDNKTLINPSFNKAQLPLNNPKKLNQVYPPNYSLSIIIIIITHLFILIPFFTEKIRKGPPKQPLDPLELENVRII